MAYVILISDVIVGKKECMFFSGSGTGKEECFRPETQITLSKRINLYKRYLNFSNKFTEKRSVNPQK